MAEAAQVSRQCNDLIIVCFSALMENSTKARTEFEKEKASLRQIIRPDDKEWWTPWILRDFNEFDQPLRRIQAIPGWQYDRELVAMFDRMRNRKRWFLRVSFVQEDLEILPVHVLYPDYVLPDLSPLSELQRQISILVFSFTCTKGTHKILKGAYEKVYRQIYAVNNWEKSVQLAYLHGIMKKEEAENKSYIQATQREQQSKNTSERRVEQRYIEIVCEKIQMERKRNPIMSEAKFFELIHMILAQKNWSKDRRLCNLYMVLLGQLRILKLKADKNWDGREKGTSGTKEAQQQKEGDSSIMVFTTKPSSGSLFESVWAIFSREEQSQQAKND